MPVLYEITERKKETVSLSGERCDVQVI